MVYSFDGKFFDNFVFGVELIGCAAAFIVRKELSTYFKKYYFEIELRRERNFYQINAIESHMLVVRISKLCRNRFRRKYVMSSFYIFHSYVAP